MTATRISEGTNEFGRNGLCADAGSVILLQVRKTSVSQTPADGVAGAGYSAFCFGIIDFVILSCQAAQ